MLRFVLIFLAALCCAGQAFAFGYVPGDPNVPVFSSSNLTGGCAPSAETPTNFSMVCATPIAQPAQQMGPAAMTQSFSANVSGNTLTIESTLSSSLPSGTQVLNASINGCPGSPTSSAPGNCPTVIAGSGTAIGSTYTLSGPASGILTGISVNTIPLGLNEDALVAHDTQKHKQFDSGYAFGCIKAKHIQGIDHVAFRLNGGGTWITATNTTTNSDTGVADYCWAASVTLFSGKNGVHQVDACAYPVAGWPVCLQSSYSPTITASSGTMTVRGLTPLHIALTSGAQFGQKMVEITSSSDPVTFPTAKTAISTATSNANIFSGVYCYAALDADHFGLVEAGLMFQPGRVRPFLANCFIQSSGTMAASTGVLTLTGPAANVAGGTVIVGQTVSFTGCSACATVTAVDGSNCSVGCQTSYSGGSFSGTFTFAGVIPATASGATITMVPFHAGGTFEKNYVSTSATVAAGNAGSYSNGAQFFIANPTGANQIPEITAYASLTGNNSNPATAVSPAATLQGAMVAVTPTTGANTATQTQTLGSASGCTTFTRTGNRTGAVPFQQNMPVKYDGLSAPNGIFVEDGVYFVNVNGSSDTVTLSAVPGGACINDTNLAGSSGTSAAFYYDYSLTTLYMQHSGSGVNNFSLGDYSGTPSSTNGAIIHFAHLGFMTVAWDPATATFDDVEINGIGIGSTAGNSALNGLGVDNLHVIAKGVYPTATVHLTQDVPKYSTISQLTFLSSDVANFPIIPSTATQQGTRTTQLIPGDGCLVSSGGADQTADTVTVSGSSTAGPNETVTLGYTNSQFGTPSTFAAFNECPTGTPVQLIDPWSYDGFVNLWFDHSTIIAPTPSIAQWSGQLFGANITGDVTSTFSSLQNLGQGFDEAEWVADSVAAGAASKGMANVYDVSNSRIDLGGNQSFGPVSSLTGFQAYGLAQNEVTDTASINGTITVTGGVATLTVNSVSSGQPKPGMQVAYSGSPTAQPAIAMQPAPSGCAGVVCFTLSPSVTAVGPIAMTMTRSIWTLAPPSKFTASIVQGTTAFTLAAGSAVPIAGQMIVGDGITNPTTISGACSGLNCTLSQNATGTATNEVFTAGQTTIGNTTALPSVPVGFQAQWLCTGVAQSGALNNTVVGFDRGLSQVIVAGFPTGPCVVSDGSSLFMEVNTTHEDMFIWVVSTSEFIAGINADGLTIDNSEGYGWIYLTNPGKIQNAYLGNSSVHIFRTLNGHTSSYDDATPATSTENLLWRNNNYGFFSNGTPSAVNGTFVVDGCSASNAGQSSYLTNITNGVSASIPGLVIRNTGWPGQGSLAAGNC